MNFWKRRSKKLQADVSQGICAATGIDGLGFVNYPISYM